MQQNEYWRLSLIVLLVSSINCDCYFTLMSKLDFNHCCRTLICIYLFKLTWIDTLYSHHEAGTVRRPAYTVGFFIMLHYRGDFAFSLRQIEFPGNLFFLKKNNVDDYNDIKFLLAFKLNAKQQKKHEFSMKIALVSAKHNQEALWECLAAAKTKQYKSSQFLAKNLEITYRSLVLLFIFIHFCAYLLNAIALIGEYCWICGIFHKKILLVWVCVRCVCWNNLRCRDNDSSQTMWSPSSGEIHFQRKEPIGNLFHRIAVKCHSKYWTFSQHGWRCNARICFENSIKRKEIDIFHWLMTGRIKQKWTFWNERFQSAVQLLTNVSKEYKSIWG